MATKKKVETADVKPEVIRATVIGGAPLNIRQDPSMDNPPVGQIPEGTVIEILEERKKWCKVAGGYVMRKYLEF